MTGISSEIYMLFNKVHIIFFIQFIIDLVLFLKKFNILKRVIIFHFFTS